jgi:hypothetical protein
MTTTRCDTRPCASPMERRRRSARARSSCENIPSLPVRVRETAVHTEIRWPSGSRHTAVLRAPSDRRRVVA